MNYNYYLQKSKPITQEAVSPPLSGTYSGGAKVIASKPSPFMSGLSRQGQGWDRDDDTILRRERDRGEYERDDPIEEDEEVEFDCGPVQKNTLTNYFGSAGKTGVTSRPATNYGIKKNLNDLLNSSLSGNNYKKDDDEGWISKGSSSSNTNNTSKVSSYFNKELEASTSGGIASKNFYGGGGSVGSWVDKPKIKGGIRNLGNSCYMSAIMQVLICYCIVGELLLDV
jgi:hypothetical protein